MTELSFLNEMVIELSEDDWRGGKCSPDTLAERGATACWFRLDDEILPAFNLPQADMRAMAARELRFLALYQLVTLRRRLGRRLQKVDEVSRGRRAYRTLYRSLAAGIVSSTLAEVPTVSPSGTAVRLGARPRWIESSRRVIELPNRCGSSSPPVVAVCHVSAFAGRNLVERFLVEYLSRFAQPRGWPHGLRDKQTEFVLIASPARSVNNRFYCQVVIAPPDTRTFFDHEPRLSLDTVDLALTASLAHPSNSGKVIDVMDDISRVEAPGAETGSAHTGAVTEGARERERAMDDLRIVRLAVEHALADGTPIDSEFVKRTAEERLGFVATRYSFPPGAGPTLESSQQIVRDLVDVIQALTGTM